LDITCKPKPSQKGFIPYQTFKNKYFFFSERKCRFVLSTLFVRGCVCYERRRDEKRDKMFINKNSVEALKRRT